MPLKIQRVHVSNTWVLGTWVVVSIVLALGKYMVTRYLDPRVRIAPRVVCRVFRTKLLSYPLAPKQISNGLAAKENYGLLIVASSPNGACATTSHGHLSRVAADRIWGFP